MSYELLIKVKEMNKVGLFQITKNLKYLKNLEYCYEIYNNNSRHIWCNKEY